MNKIGNQILEITLISIVGVWIFTNAAGFSAVANATSQTIVGSVNALWGRSPATAKGL